MPLTVGSPWDHHQLWADNNIQYMFIYNMDGNGDPDDPKIWWCPHNWCVT